MAKRIGIISLLALTLFSFGARASTIPGLFDTGKGIGVDKQTDFNYKLTDSLGNAVYGGYGEAAVGNGGYVGKKGSLLGDSGTSHWLTPTSKRSQSFDPSVDGVYKWTIDFNLKGYSANTASFSGRFSADNSAVAYLNGHEIGHAGGYTDWYTFVADSNLGLFVKGTNELQFVVTNYHQRAGNPTGLRVEFADSNVSAVPIPAAIWLFVSALSGLLAITRKSSGFLGII